MSEYTSLVGKLTSVRDCIEILAQNSIFKEDKIRIVKKVIPERMAEFESSYLENFPLSQKRFHKVLGVLDSLYKTVQYHEPPLKDCKYLKALIHGATDTFVKYHESPRAGVRIVEKQHKDNGWMMQSPCLRTSPV